MTNVIEPFLSLKLIKPLLKENSLISHLSNLNWFVIPLLILYNSLVEQHHYLGYRQIVGNHLKYMAFIEDRPVACLGWGSAAWSVKSRESFIVWENGGRIRIDDCRLPIDD